MSAALARLSAAGVGTALLDRLAQTQFTVANLEPGGLGMAYPSLNRILLDNGARRGCR